MATLLVHRSLDHEADLCGHYREGDALSVVASEVTCPECRRLLPPGPEECPSRSQRHGWRCAGRRNHGGVHHAEVGGCAFAWTDTTSPALSVDLPRPA